MSKHHPATENKFEQQTSTERVGGAIPALPGATIVEQLETGTGMFAPEADEAIVSLAIASIDPSPYNKERAKRYVKEDLVKLGENLRALGQISPAVVRTTTAGRYEMIAGERRMRASEMAGRTELRCVVRQLSDRDAADVVLSENLHRANLKPVEEAAVFVDLLKAKDSSGAPLYPNAESLYKITGRKKDVISLRIRLLLVPAELQKEIDEGRVASRVGEMIGKIPNAKKREEAAGRALHRQHGAGPMTVADVQGMIAEDYMVSLRKCSFAKDDADLVPLKTVEGVRVCGGACISDGPVGSCPFRTGSDTEFGELLGLEIETGQRGKPKGFDQNMCQNPECYQAKEEASWKAVEKSAESRGIRLLPKTKVEGLFPSWGGDYFGSEGYIELNEKPGYQETGHHADEEMPAWEDLLKDTGVSPIWVRNPKTKEVHHLLERSVAMETARAKLKQDGKKDIFVKPLPAGGGKSSRQQNTGPLEWEIKRARERKIHGIVLQDLLKGWKSRPFTPALALALLELKFATCYSGDTEGLVDCLEMPKPKDKHTNVKSEKVLEFIKKSGRTAMDILALFACQVVGESLGECCGGDEEKDVLNYLKLYGVDQKAIEKKVLEEEKVEQEAAAKAKAEKAPAKKAGAVKKTPAKKAAKKVATKKTGKKAA